MTENDRPAPPVPLRAGVTRLKRSLRRKVRALGVLQVTLIAAIMMLLGILFFNKMLTDQERFAAGTRRVKREEAEGLAKLLALELGRLDQLRYARSNRPEAMDVARSVRAVLWEKVTFIGELRELDLIAWDGTGAPVCIRPIHRPGACDRIDGFDALLLRYPEVARIERIADGVYLFPLYVAGSFWGLVRMGISVTTVEYTLENLAYFNAKDRAAFILLFVVCLAAAGIFLFVVLAAFTRRMLRPLLALARTAQAFGEHPDAAGEPVDADPEDEIGVLATAFSQMQGRLADTIDTLRHAIEQKEQAIRDIEEKDRMLRHSERLASVGVLAAGVAHEIGNKLNPMAFVTHNLRRRIEKGRELDTGQLDVLSQSIESCTDIIEKLKALVRPSEEPEEDVSLDHIVDDVASLLGEQTRSRGFRLDVVHGEGVPPVRGVRGDLTQVIINLLLNARDALIAAGTEQGMVRLLTRVGADGGAVLEVSDNGVGMTDTVRARVFEPFFTTKGLKTGSAEGGTGLGLYICYGILNRHGVEPEIETAPGKGTRFVLAFPPAGSRDDGGDGDVR